MNRANAREHPTEPTESPRASYSVGSVGWVPAFLPEPDDQPGEHVEQSAARTSKHASAIRMAPPPGARLAQSKDP